MALKQLKGHRWLPWLTTTWWLDGSIWWWNEIVTRERKEALSQIKGWSSEWLLTCASVAAGTGSSPQRFVLMVDIAVRADYPNYKKRNHHRKWFGIQKMGLWTIRFYDDGRIDYIETTLGSSVRCDCRWYKRQGFFIRSLMDVFSWSNGYEKRWTLLNLISIQKTTI